MNTQFSRRLLPFFVLFWLLSLVLAACSAATPIPTYVPTSPADTYWPTQGWRASSPEEQGMDSQKLAQILEQANSKSLNLHSLLVIRHGYIVSETYFGSYQQDTRHDLYSCTKSFISTLVGIALDRGKLTNTNQRVLDFFPNLAPQNRDAQKEAMTLADLLTMRSGLDWQEGDPVYTAMYRSPDWVKYVLDKPMVSAPGSQFNYCSGCTHVLSAILQRTTGQSTRDFAEQYLFKPLGIVNVSWEADSNGIAIGGWGLQLTPREMAKLGYLYLHNGAWDGQQIVSANWVKTATEKHTATNGNSGYGYQWWTYPALNGYMASGRYSQLIVVIPASDLVIVTTAAMDDSGEIFKLIEQYIAPAIR
jgi:CubicO group peptidase (beta-lactamase class C family)